MPSFNKRSGSFRTIIFETLSLQTSDQFVVLRDENPHATDKRQTNKQTEKKSNTRKQVYFTENSVENPNRFCTKWLSVS